VLQLSRCERADHANVQSNLGESWRGALADSGGGLQEDVCRAPTTLGSQKPSFLKLRSKTSSTEDLEEEVPNGIVSLSGITPASASKRMMTPKVERMKAQSALLPFWDD
jgi:hypothetical protein